MTAVWSIGLVSFVGAAPSTERLSPPRLAASGVAESCDGERGAPSGSLAGKNENAPGFPLRAFSCCNGLTASRPTKPVDASFVGSATVWLALDPVTKTPPARSAAVSGSA